MPIRVSPVEMAAQGLFNEAIDSNEEHFSTGHVC